MNGYEPSTPRVALGLTAVAMAVITVGALVVLPAELDSIGTDPNTLAAAKAAAKAPIEVATSPERIVLPAAVNRGEHVDPRRTALGEQEFGGKRDQVSSRSRTGIWRGRSYLRYSDSHD
jgi:hypothetical protein